MRNVFKIILIACVIIALIRCEKDEKNELVNIPYKFNVPDYFVEEVFSEIDKRGLDESVKTNFIQSVNVIKTRSKTPFTSSGFGPATNLNECDSLIINPIEMQGLINLRTKDFGDGTCDYRIYSDLRLNPNVEIVQTIRSNGDIYNFFFDILGDCEVVNSNPAGTWKFVEVGQSNVSPAQVEIQEIYEDVYVFTFPGIPFPLHTIQVTNPDYVLALAKNLDHQYMGHPYVGSFGSVDGIPLHYMIEKERVEIGKRFEFMFN